MKEKRSKIILGLLMALLLYFVFFLRLTSFHIRTWDESIYAVNAYEMLESGNYIVPTNKGSIDHMHSKPPLGLWVEAMSIKIFGMNELGVRFPSAMAAAISSLLLFAFIRKYFGWELALCSFLVLTTSLGYSTFHTSRTGDLDALLTCLLLVANVSLFNFIGQNEKGNKSIFLFFLFMALAFLTKSFAALLFVPAQILIILVSRKLGVFLKAKGTYWGLLLFFMVNGIYYYLRIKQDKEFITTLVSSDLVRVTQSIDLHREPFDFYFNNFVTHRFGYWILFFVLGAILLAIGSKRDELIKRLALWSLALAGIFFLVISMASTKLEWYDTPLFPYLALVSGYAVFYFVKQVAQSDSIKYIFIGLIFIIPIFLAIRQSEKSEISAGEKKWSNWPNFFIKRNPP